MHLVTSRQQAGGHRSIGGVGQQLHAADLAPHGVLPGQLHREGGRCDLMLNRPEHAANGRDLGQVPRRGLLDGGTELGGQRRVQQVDQLVVGDAPRGRRRHGAAQSVYDTVTEWLEPLFHGVLPGFVRLAHFGQRYPLPGRPGH